MAKSIVYPAVNPSTGNSFLLLQMRMFTMELAIHLLVDIEILNSEIAQFFWAILFPRNPVPVYFLTTFTKKQQIEIIYIHSKNIT